MAALTVQRIGLVLCSRCVLATLRARRGSRRRCRRGLARQGEQILLAQQLLTPQIVVHDKDKLVMPIHVASTHWIGAVVDLRRGQIRLFDSLSGLYETQQTVDVRARKPVTADQADDNRDPRQPPSACQFERYLDVDVASGALQ